MRRFPACDTMPTSLLCSRVDPFHFLGDSFVEFNRGRNNNKKTSTIASLASFSRALTLLSKSDSSVRTNTCSSGVCFYSVCTETSGSFRTVSDHLAVSSHTKTQWLCAHLHPSFASSSVQRYCAVSWRSCQLWALNEFRIHADHASPQSNSHPSPGSEHVTTTMPRSTAHHLRSIPPPTPTNERWQL